MKKSIKIWLIVLASLLGLGLVFCMVGAVMGGRLYNAARLMVYGPWGRHIETVVNSDQSDYSYWPSWWDHDYPYYEDFEDYRKEQSQYWQERRDEWRDKAEQERDRWERDWDWDRSDNHSGASTATAATARLSSPQPCAEQTAAAAIPAAMAME